MLIATGAQAAGALNAGVQIDRDCRMRQIGLQRFAWRETWFTHSQFLGRMIGFVMPRVTRFRSVGEQQFEHYLLRFHRGLRFAPARLPEQQGV